MRVCFWSDTDSSTVDAENFGQAGFMACGAYALGMTAHYYHISFWWGIPIGLIYAVGLGFLVGDEPQVARLARLAPPMVNELVARDADQPRDGEIGNCVAFDRLHRREKRLGGKHLCGRAQRAQSRGVVEPVRVDHRQRRGQRRLGHLGFAHRLGIVAVLDLAAGPFGIAAATIAVAAARSGPVATIARAGTGALPCSAATGARFDCGAGFEPNVPLTASQLDQSVRSEFDRCTNHS